MSNAADSSSSQSIRMAGEGGVVLASAWNLDLRYGVRETSAVAGLSAFRRAACFQFGS